MVLPGTVELDPLGLEVMVIILGIALLTRSDPGSPMTAPAAMLPVVRPCSTAAAVQAVAAVLRSGWITSGPKVVDGLERRGIGTALHFPPVYSQTFYRQKYPGCSLPASEDVGARLLTIPLFPGMGEGDVARVVAALRQVEAELLP